MSKNIRKKIKLISTANTGHFYTTTKNKNKSTRPIKIKKFDPFVQKHVVYTEHKL